MQIGSEMGDSSEDELLFAVPEADSDDEERVDAAAEKAVATSFQARFAEHGVSSNDTGST